MTEAAVSDSELTTTASSVAPTNPLTRVIGRAILAVTRVLLGFVFIWAGVDKVFGLGVSTPPEKAWIAGDLPTSGYLKSVDGYFADTFHFLAGQTWVNWLFVPGLLLVGLALALGVALRLAALGTAMLMIPLWLSSLPLENNPIVDQHIIYTAVAILLAVVHAGRAFGLGQWWESLHLFAGWRWFT